MSNPWEISPFAFLQEEGDSNYKKELASCPEFTLYEHFREGGPTSVELSINVEGAYHKVKVNANAADGQKERIAMAQLLDDLGALGKLWEVTSEGGNRDMLIEHFGKKLLPVLVESIGVPIARAKSLEKERREIALRDISTAFKSGTESLHRKYTPKLGASTKGQAILPLNQLLIPVAVAQFQKERKRPTKSKIRSQLEGMGYHLAKKETWDDNFIKVNLGGLSW